MPEAWSLGLGVSQPWFPSFAPICLANWHWSFKTQLKCLPWRAFLVTAT